LKLFFRIFITCPPVRTFGRKIKECKEERRNKIESQLLVYMSTLSSKKKGD
jgi:hypothetical protein